MFENDKQQPVGLEDDQAFETSLIAAADLSHLPEAEILDSSSDSKGDSSSTTEGDTSVIDQPNWIGKRFARFKLLKLLGEGSMGRVILAEDMNLHRMLALKVLRRQIKGMNGELAVQQFLREAGGAAKLDHPNVVRIYEINEHDGWWYIAMEYVEGETLARITKAAGSLAPQRAAALIADGALALDVAHENGIIHRDVKPSNLMVNRQGVGKLTDFGLVRLDAVSDPFEFHDKSVGTPKFMAPEVIRRGTQTPAIDVYSLGATFYFALTGRPPFTGKTVKSILSHHVKTPPPDARDLARDCPQGVAELIQQMMAKMPGDRPSPGDVAAMLRAEAIDWRLEQSAGSSITANSGVGSASSIAVQTDSGIISGLGSGLGSGSGSQMGAGSSVPADGPTLQLPAARQPRWRNLVGLMVAMACVVGVVIALIVTSRPNQVAGPGDSPTTPLTELFPDAPDTYGERPEGELPDVLDPRTSPSPNSWVGKLDTKGIRFLASRSGKYFYPVDSYDAALINANEVVGFADEVEAIKSGRKLFSR